MPSISTRVCPEGAPRRYTEVEPPNALFEAISTPASKLRASLIERYFFFSIVFRSITIAELPVWAIYSSIREALTNTWPRSYASSAIRYLNGKITPTQRHNKVNNLDFIAIPFSSQRGYLPKINDGPGSSDSIRFYRCVAAPGMTPGFTSFIRLKFYYLYFLISKNQCFQNHSFST